MARIKFSDENKLSGFSARPTGYGPKVPGPLPVGQSPRDMVIRAIRSAGRTARIDIAKSLSISPATVTAVTADLMDAGLIEEVAADLRSADQPRGRPRVTLKLRGAAHAFIGIKLSAQQFTLVALDFEGRELGQSTRPVPPGARALEPVLADLEDVYRDGLKAAGLTPDQVSGIGIGVPGFIDAGTGVAHWSPMLDARGVALGPLAEARLGAPVFVDNDANLVALAELWFGAGREIGDFLVVTIEHGVGMGIVLGHRLYRGTRGRGVEFGHTKVQVEGALCRCGQRGCLEAYVADYALLREAEAAFPGRWSDADDPRTRLEALGVAAREGHPGARAVFDRAGRMLSIGLANMINIFDPALIILAGERMQYDMLTADGVGDEIGRNILGLETDPPEIRLRRFGDHLWAKGAAALAMDAMSAEGFGEPGARADA